MVALRGYTRILESFAEYEAQNSIEDVLEWVFLALTKMIATSNKDFDSELVIKFLLRPICEHLNVNIQTHPSVRISILKKVMFINLNWVVTEV